ncbi:MAG: hypothetical protein O7G86_18085, partial [Gammaproteobacteria bacterium]|nr:hypothetical protein [Gammaproteobacteria bacterium]
HQPLRGKGVEGGDRNVLTRGLSANRGSCLFQRLDAIRNPGVVAAAHLGQLQPSRRTFEELNTQVSFEFGYLLTDGTLGDVQFLSGRGEACVTGGGNKGSDGIEGNIDG